MSAISSIQTTALNPAGHKTVAATLSPAEKKLFCIMLATIFAGFVIAAFRHQAVDWPDFWLVIAISLEMIFVGVVIRRTRHLARTATGMIAFGLIVCFMACGGILTFTILPFSNPMVDQYLLLADAAIGFSWVESVNHLADYPAFAGALRYIYFSLFPQIAFVIILLSFLKREVDLHRFLMVGFLSMIATDCIWYLFPSVGPAAYDMVTQEVQQKVQLVANAEYGEKMWRYATQGNLLITGSKMAAVVAFPSMHIVMTAMVLWFTRRTWMFYPLLVLNFLMPVATVLQGGHHIMDLLGGFLVFFFCVKLANLLIPKQDHAPAARL